MQVRERTVPSTVRRVDVPVGVGSFEGLLRLSTTSARSRASGRMSDSTVAATRSGLTCRDTWPLLRTTRLRYPPAPRCTRLFNSVPFGQTPRGTGINNVPLATGVPSDLLGLGSASLPLGYWTTGPECGVAPEPVRAVRTLSAETRKRGYVQDSL